MRTRMGLVVAAALIAASCAEDAPAGPPFRTETSVRMLMANMIDPAADLLWDAVGTVIDETGETHWEPETEEDWLQVRLGAMTIAETANLLMMDDRARDQEQWIEMSQGMADAAMLAFAAAEAEDAEEIFDLGETVYNSCNACHGLYWVDDADRGRAVAPEL
jgi:hypothetical protein